MDASEWTKNVTHDRGWRGSAAPYAKHSCSYQGWIQLQSSQLFLLQSPVVVMLWIFNNSSIWLPSFFLNWAGSAVCRSVAIVKMLLIPISLSDPSPAFQQEISSSEQHTTPLCSITYLWRSCFQESSQPSKVII